MQEWPISFFMCKAYSYLILEGASELSSFLFPVRIQASCWPLSLGRMHSGILSFSLFLPSLPIPFISIIFSLKLCLYDIFALPWGLWLLPAKVPMLQKHYTSSSSLHDFLLLWNMNFLFFPFSLLFQTCWSKVGIWYIWYTIPVFKAQILWYLTCMYSSKMITKIKMKKSLNRNVSLYSAVLVPS